MSYRRTVFFLLLFGLFNWFCQEVKTVSPRELALNRTTYAGLLDSAKYVGMNTCKSCHVNVHETFMHTGMGLSFDTASRTKSAGNYDDHIAVYDKHKNYYYQPYWKEEKLFFREFRLEGKDTVHLREEQVKYIVGSGQHTNSHMWESNGYLFQAPLTYYTQKGKWDLPPGFENGDNSRFNRLIGLECMSCHNGYPEFVQGSENKFSAVKNGIDCERCHGPGSIHVAEKSQGILIDTALQIDYSIVNPSKLPIDMQFDVCQRCHIQGNAVLRDGKSFFDFKPGMKLSEVMNVFMPIYSNSENAHIMASHAERLKMSKCFVSTDTKIRSMSPKEAGLKPYKKGLTCITCHNPHVSVKVSGKDQFNAACNNCHSGTTQVVCSADPLIKKKANDNCVSCHMPSNSTTDIPHVSVHDHRIGLHRPSISKEGLKKFLGINCINNPTVDNKTKAQAFIQYVEKFGFEISLLDSAMQLLSDKSASDIRTNFSALVHIAYLRNDVLTLQKYLRSVPDAMNIVVSKSYDNKDAWTAYRIAELLKRSNESPAAGQWFKRAYELAPLHAEFANKYAGDLAEHQQLNEAAKLYAQINKEHPEFAPAWSNHGYLVLLRDRNTLAAHQLIDKSLKLDPDYEQGLLNKAAVFLVEGNTGEARKLVMKILKINPDNVQAKQALSKLNTI